MDDLITLLDREAPDWAFLLIMALWFVESNWRQRRMQKRIETLSVLIGILTLHIKDHY